MIEDPLLRGFTHLPFEGSKLAMLTNFANIAQVLNGTLSPPTSVGSTYVLSARVATDKSAFISPLYDLRLRNSATGAQSAPLVGTAVAHATDWTLLTSTVTTTAVYDRVVIHFRLQPGDPNGARNGLVDEVHLCTMPVALQDLPAGWWTTARLIAGAVLGAVLVTGLAWVGRRRFRTR